MYGIKVCIYISGFPPSCHVFEPWFMHTPVSSHEIHFLHIFIYHPGRYFIGFRVKSKIYSNLHFYCGWESTASAICYCRLVPVPLSFKSGEQAYTPRSWTGNRDRLPPKFHCHSESSATQIRLPLDFHCHPKMFVAQITLRTRFPDTYF